MNTNTPTKRLRGLGTALLFSVPALLATQAASAQIQIIDWGGDYVSANQSFSNKFENGNSDNGYGGFSGGEPLNITPSSGYTGGTIYGHIQELDNGGSSLQPFNGVVNSGDNDYIQLKGDNNNREGPQPVAFLLLWQQEDFLNGGNSGAVSFDANSSVRMNVTKYVGQHANDSGRLVLRLNNGSYYVSEQIFNSEADHTIDNLIDLDYFAYDPTSSVDVNNDSLVGESIMSEGLINGITSVGFYFESNDVNAVYVRDFKVNVSTIPEPSTYAMIFGGLALALAMVRRRQKNG